MTMYIQTILITLFLFLCNPTFGQLRQMNYYEFELTEKSDHAPSIESTLEIFIDQNTTLIRRKHTLDEVSIEFYGLKDHENNKFQYMSNWNGLKGNLVEMNESINSIIDSLPMIQYDLKKVDSETLVFQELNCSKYQLFINANELGEVWTSAEIDDHHNLFYWDQNIGFPVKYKIEYSKEHHQFLLESRLVQFSTRELNINELISEFKPMNNQDFFDQIDPTPIVLAISLVETFGLIFNPFPSIKQ